VKSQSFTVIGALFVIFSIAAGAVGWVLNIYKLAMHWSWPPDGAEVVRVIGVFVAPIGAAFGYF
jgi:hypothetical protein